MPDPLEKQPDVLIVGAVKQEERIFLELGGL
jgi:hypothetical protein